MLVYMCFYCDWVPKRLKTRKPFTNKGQTYLVYMNNNMIPSEALIPRGLDPMKVIDRTKAVTQHFLENSFKKLSIKKKIKNEKSEKHKNIILCFLNVCCVMML